MTDDLEEAPPRRFTFRQRLILAIVPPLASWLYRALYATCRVEIRGIENFEGLKREGRLGLGGFWHEAIALVACAHQGRDYYTLTSYSFDGELAARFAKQFGARSVRGSSSRGGVKALALLERAAKNSDGVAYTLDGPRGPRRIAKPGICLVSARTGYWVLPGAAAASKSWRLNSWDRFIIPKPGARIIIVYGTPIPPPADERPDTVRAAAQALTDELNAVHRAIETELGIAET